MITSKSERKQQRKQNTLNTERLEQRAMFSVCPMNFDVELKQPIQDNSSVTHETSQYIGSVSLAATPLVHHGIGRQVVELPSGIINQEPPMINDVFNQSPLIDERIEQLSPSWNHYSDVIMQEDYRSQHFERAVVGVSPSDIIEYWAKAGARGYYAADQGYNDALERQETRFSEIGGFGDIDLNGDGKTGPNTDNNGYDELEEKGWLRTAYDKVEEAIEQVFGKEEEKEEEEANDDTSGITAESEGRYLLHESPASDADSMAERFRNVREIYDPFETIANQDNYSPNNFIRVNAYMKARSQVFAMMGR